ncbi:MAG: hypothetical protein H6657_13895 [Ardenticatenaceae bacterium]|nr:hypothetical protein [Ardenticatenaceae bacterium]
MAKLLRIFPLAMIMGLLLGLANTPRVVPAPAAKVAPAVPAAASSASNAAPYALTARLQTIPDSYELLAENQNFQLYANRETLAFKVVDKRSGYIWHSNLDEKAEEDRLNKTWTAFAQSGISIDYLDEKATDERASITNSEHTIDFQTNDQGFAATVHFLDPSITMVVNVTLEADGVRVEVPHDGIKEEDPAFKLGLLYVYPFFGAVRDDSIPGYMFIPDGAGTIVRFAAETKAQNMFYGRYYGTDLGMIGTLPYDPLVNRPYKLNMPVIGMVHQEKENAYIQVVEKGASYGEVHMHPAGVITNFSFMYNAFVYNQSYFQATNRSGAGVTTLQPTTNNFDVAIHYRFLTGDESDYVGMARSYQAYLIEKGMLPTVDQPDSNIGIRLEFLGGEKEKVLFWFRSIPMTTVAQMQTILAELDIQNPEVVYYGWQPGGATSMPPTSLRLDRKLGNVNALSDLADEITAVNGRLFLYLDPQAAILDEKGYSLRYDLAMAITNVNLVGFNRNKVNYYLNDEALNGRYTDLSEDLATELNAGWALDGIGSTLYTDFKPSHFINREDTIQLYQSILAENNIATSFYQPNDYLFGHMQAYYDMPLGDSGYIYTTETVPFLQIVLSGYVPYYGTALNFSSNLRADLLRHADYGVYPSYYLTQEVTAKILNTNSNWIYTSSYNQWGSEVETTYQWLNNLLEPVKGAHIVARQSLANGVMATSYSNGRQIIVNYNNTPYSADGLVVPAQDAIVTEVTP